MKRFLVLMTLLLISSNAMSQSWLDKIGSAFGSGNDIAIPSASIQIPAYSKLKISNKEIAMVYGFDKCKSKETSDNDRCITISNRATVKVVIFRTSNQVVTEEWRVINNNSKFKLYRPNGFQVTSP